MTPSLFQMLLLAAASIGIAQTRHLLAKELAKHQVTSSLGTRVASVETQSILKYYNNNNTSFAVEGANASSTQQPQPQPALEHPRQRQLRLEDDGNGIALTVYIRSPKSVVQDWSLVCQQLCGAGLGGPPCDSHCHSSEEPSLLPAFSGYKQNICKDLCRLQLGDQSCNCTADEAVTTMSQNTTNSQYEWGNVVCNSFCEHSRETLTGCSICMEDDAEVQVSMRSTVETTTPDWKELCVALCKTGDGGSLCNCDLAPFF
ncbi:uncharacterized protein LOC118748002 [Rhagoletis pomonella]|uniref:uncharacterized protein LOC118748002 n=1 Tax=Rhagoletis pomonella TaxID=28610 RepID=UPI00177C0B5C|nr:uncharacterized protein LOC118748002 [Rhagoletis pomonella]